MPFYLINNINYVIFNYNLKHQEMETSRKEQLLNLQSQRDSLRASTTKLAKMEQWDELEKKLETLGHMDRLWDRLTENETLSKHGRLLS